MERPDVSMPKEFGRFHKDRSLRGCIIIILHGYESTDPRHEYINRRRQWAVGASGRPRELVTYPDRLMQFDSIAAAHAWMRERPLKKRAPAYQMGFYVGDEEYQCICLFEPVAWIDVERIRASVNKWNRKVMERAVREHFASAEAEVLRPYLIEYGVRPRTVTRIIRARVVELLDPESDLSLMLSDKEYEALECVVDLQRVAMTHGY